MKGKLEENIDSFLKEINAKKIIKDRIIHLKNHKKIVLTVSFEFNNYNLEMSFANTFPFELPNFKLKGYDKFTPHIDEEGNICYIEKESVSYDYKNIPQILRHCFNRVLETLKDKESRIIETEFKEEFLNYWERNKKYTKNKVYKFINEYSSNAKFLNSAIIKGKDSIFIYETNEEKIAKINNLEILKSSTLEKVLYIPINSFDELPPRYDEDIELQWFEEKIEKYCSEENKIFLKNLIIDKIKLKIFLHIFTEKYNFFIGIELFKNNNNSIIFSLSKQNWKENFNLISAKPINKSFTSKRIIKRQDTKKVLVIGAGSVGGYVIDGLTKMGIESITVIDKDYISDENLHRHFLSNFYIYQKKALAIKKFYEKSNPFVTIEAVTEDIVEVIKDKDLNGYDLIISCTGDRTLDLYLNDYFSKDKNTILFCYNEAYDIGGHVIIKHKGSRGCLNCCFGINSDQVSFIQLGKNQIRKQELGCGSYYTPYSNLSSLKTSNLVLESIAKIFDGNLLKSKIISWKGDSKTLIDNGFTITERYKNIDGNYLEKLIYPEGKCGTCSYGK